MNSNIPPFYIGQEIVAIRDHSQGVFKKGDEFTVASIRKGCCVWEITIGIKSDTEMQECTTCGITFPSGEYVWLSVLSFAPKQQQFKAITCKQVINIESTLISVN